MLTIKLGETEVKIHNHPSQLPGHIYKEFQRCLLIDSGVGSDMDSISNRFNNLFKLLKQNKVVESMREAENLYYTHYAILERVNYKHLAFACLLHSIDGEQIEDYSPETLSLKLEQLFELGLTQEKLEYILDDSKKKSFPF